MTPIRRVLVANRGEIAVRIIRACFDAGIETVLPVSTADRDSLPAQLADRVVVIGPPAPTLSYLSLPAIMTAALATDCDALHPGYGFLSERPDLPELCAEHGITFIGPPAEVMRRGGDKGEARDLAASLGVPVSDASPIIDDADLAATHAARLGFPLLIKAAAGGGGRGMIRVGDEQQLRAEVPRAIREARDAFGDGRIFLERFVEHGRHVEVQILGDRHGNLIHLGERDCSVQRRYQKVIEEAPAAGLPAALRRDLHDAAVTLGRAMGYEGAGTVEFLVDVDRGDFSFLEINTRIQVEHPVTEMVTGVDLVAEQLRVAAGAPLSIRQDEVTIRGHAIECRITAEDAAAGFVPTPGRVGAWAPPQGADVRVDTHVQPGYLVSPYYDSLLAKLICRGSDRTEALETTRRALDHFTVDGVRTVIPLLRDIVADPTFHGDPVHTQWLEREFMPRWTADVRPVSP